MKRIFILLIIPIALMALSHPGTAQAEKKYSLLEGSKIDTKMLEQILNEGMMLLVAENEDGSLQLITSGILINRPPMEVYDVIMDYDKYPEYMPSTEEALVIKHEENMQEIKFRIKFTFSILSYTVEYILRYALDPGKSIRWDFVSGDIADAYGSWEFIPLANGTKTAAIYSVYTDIRSIGRVVRYFIEKEPSMDIAINGSACSLVLKKTKERVESLACAAAQAPPAKVEQKPESEKTSDVTM